MQLGRGRTIVRRTANLICGHPGSARRSVLVIAPAICLTLVLADLVGAENYGSRDRCGPHEDGFGGWLCPALGTEASGQIARSNSALAETCGTSGKLLIFFGDGIAAQHVQGIVRGQRRAAVDRLDAQGQLVGWQLAVERAALPGCQISFRLLDADGRAIGARGAQAVAERTEIAWFIELEHGGSYGDRRISADNFVDALGW